MGERVIDYDVDGLSVWCEANGCTNRDRCLPCDYTYEAESLNGELESNPYLTRDECERWAKRRDELRAAAARLDAERL